MNEQKLKEKMRYFFRTRRKGRKAAVEFIKQLNKYGELVIIGGMLRDLSLEGNTSFYSDIDLVINPRNLDEFEEIIKSYHAKQNKYVRYGLLIE